MFDQFPLLSLLIFMPLLGAVFVCFVPSEEVQSIKKVALWTALATFSFSLIVCSHFDFAASGYQLMETYAFVPALGVRYLLGMDGLSVFLVLLTTLLIPICIAVGWESITRQVKLYICLFLLLETLVLGSFLSLNLVLFYVFFEGVLVPMYFLIGIWGGSDRMYAAFKFFLYTMLGSVLMLVAVLALFVHTGTLDLPDLLHANIPLSFQYFLWICFFASFAVKVPMWPLHTWLPDAHVQAPTAASVILAGVLLKMGGYGFLRFALPLTPLPSMEFMPYVFGLSVMAVFYTSLIALVQKDMKKLIAYSSVAHMGVVTMGIFSSTTQGISGAIFHMISHGLVSGALFICVGILYDRTHTRDIQDYGGIAKVMPVFAVIFMLLTFATIGVPGTSGFIGELFVVFAGASHHFLWAAGIGLGLILGAAYSLGLYRDVVLGPLDKENLLALKDLTRREVMVFVPLVALILLLGIYPRGVLSTIDRAAQDIHKTYLDQSQRKIDANGFKKGIFK